MFGERVFADRGVGGGSTTESSRLRRVVPQPHTKELLTIASRSRTVVSGVLRLVTVGLLVVWLCACVAVVLLLAATLATDNGMP
jgi:hypothetical protein